MKQLYKLIFDNSRWWWGKLAGSALIGVVAFGAGTLHSQDEFIKEHRLDFAIAGGGIGLLAGIILVVSDWRQGVSVDAATHPSSGGLDPVSRSIWPLVGGLIGFAILASALYGVWYCFHLRAG